MFKRVLSAVLVIAMLLTTMGLPAAATNSATALSGDADSVVLDSDGYYRYYLDGVIQTKWTVSPEGYKYYFSTSSSKYGAAMVGKNQKISSSYYDFTSDGKLIEKYDDEGNPVLFCDPSQGVTYTVTYNSMGGACDVTQRRYITGKEADLTIACEKSGVMFAGWSLVKGSKNCIGSLTVNEDTTLYAVYTDPADLKVELCDDGYYRYYINGVAQTGWVVAADGHKYYFSTSSSKYGAAMVGSNVKIGAAYYNFTDDGKLIEGTDSSGNQILYYDPAADYRPVVTYDYATNGGISAEKTEARVTKGLNADLTVTAQKENSVFVGWNTDPSAKVAISSLKVTKNITLYAIFADLENNKVVFCEDGYYRYYINGIAQTGWQIATDGHKYYFSSSSSKYGAAMVGKQIKIGGSYYDFTEDGKLIVSYDNAGNSVLFYDPLYDSEVEKATVTYDYKTNGGISASKSEVMVTLGDKADLSVTAEKTDCTFLGWNTDKNATKGLLEFTVTEDVVLYAIFKSAGSNKVVLDSDGFYRYYVNGEKQIGFWIIDGYKYYFSGSNATKGNAYVNQTTAIKNVSYTFNNIGVVVDGNGAPYVYKPDVEIAYVSALYAPEGTTVSWTASASNTVIKGYKIYRAEGENVENADFELIGTLTDTLDGSAYNATYNSTKAEYEFAVPFKQVTFVDETTAADKVYIYRVEAICDDEIAFGKVAIRTKTGTDKYVTYDSATGKWYYYVAGNVQTGWHTVPSGERCFFSTSPTAQGAALTGKNTIGSSVYRFTNYGALYESVDTGLNPVISKSEITIPGVAVKELKRDSDGYYRYYIDGIVQVLWQIGPDGHKYYFSKASDKYGAALTGKGQTIRSDVYDFTDDGKLIESYDDNGNPVLFYDENYDMTPVVIYDHNNGSLVTEKVRVKKGEKADLTKKVNMENYIFLGWNTDKNATEGLESYTVEGDVTLYAIFTDTIAEGTTGDLKWSFKADKTFFLTGSGATESYSKPEDVPWAEYREEVERVVLDETITNIGANVFYGFTKIKTINIPEKTLYITSAFAGCSSLENITVSSGNERFTSLDGVLFGYDNSTLFCYPPAKKGTVYNIPGATEAIFPQAFWGSKLEEITIPENIVKIEEYAFYECNNLKKAKCERLQEDWGRVYVLEGNDCLLNVLEFATRKYTVTYDAATNGGTCTTSAVQVAEGEYANLTVTAERTGYVFAGWNTDKNAASGFESYVVTEDVTLYAIFIETNDVVLGTDGYYRYYKGGVAQTGFWIINGYKYYFSTSASKYGAALVNTTTKIKGVNYTFDEKGRVLENSVPAYYSDIVEEKSSEISASHSTSSIRWTIEASNTQIEKYEIVRNGEVIFTKDVSVDATILQGVYKANSQGINEYIFEPVAVEISYNDEGLKQNTEYTYVIKIVGNGMIKEFEKSVVTEAYASRYVIYDEATDGWYYYIDGVAQSGWQLTPDGYKYYFSKSTGKAMRGNQKKIGSSYYDFADYGALIDSYDIDGNAVLYREINGWYTSAEDGKVRYYDKNVYRTGWQVIDGYKYYFSKSSGALLTSLTKIGSLNYLLNEEDGHWEGYYQTEYTVDESPKATDVVQGEDGNFRYYPDGEENLPLTGWKVLPGEDAYYKYYFSSASSKYGAAITDYEIQVGGSVYSFYPSGALMNVDLLEDGRAHMYPYSLTLEQGAKNGIVLDEDGKYRYYIDGEFQTGWMTVDGAKYLLRRADGSAVTDVNYKYGSYYYDFSEEGKMIRRKTGASSIYAITFAPGEASGETVTYNLVAEDCFKYILPQNTYEKEGYTFFGWSDGVNTYPAGKQVQVMKDTVFTAVWVEEQVEIIAGGSVSDTITWSLNAKGHLSIEGSGEMPAYFIGSSPWYSYRTSIKSVEFSKDLLNIGQYSMYGCAIESVEIPEGVKYISDHVFENCNNLKTITIPASVIDIETYTFTSTPALESITVAEGNKNYYSVDGVLFYKYGSSVKIIRYPSAKEGEYTVPDDVVLIDIMAFENCDKLTKVTMSNVQSIDRSSFASCGALENVVVTGDKLITIGDYAFSACTALKEITLPITLKSVGNYAFNSCKALYKVNYGGSFATWVKIKIGTNNSSLSGAGFVYGSKDYRVTFVDWDGTTIATLIAAEGGTVPAPEAPTREGYTFVGWDKDFSVVTEDMTVTAQYEENVVIPETVASGTCGSGITWELNNLGTMTISGTGSMENYRDNGSTPWNSYSGQIKKVVIGEGITRVGDYSFAYCREITEVILPESLVTLGTWSLAYTKITKLDIPDSVTKINERALLGCYTLAELTLPKNLTFIGALAFNGCTGFEKIVYHGSYSKWLKVTVETGNTNLTSKQFTFQPIEYTVTFVDYDGTVIKTESVADGSSATAPENPTREGYTFSGWDKDFSAVTGDLTVTAQYYAAPVIKYYTVTFVDWDGTTIGLPQLVEEGKSATAPTDFGRVDHVFTGWDVDFSNVTSNLTVTAQYEIRYTVTFVDENGNIISEQKVAPGESAKEPDVPSKSGYIFLGWDKDFSNVTSSLYIRPLYEKIPEYFTVSFVDWDGTVLKTETVLEGNGATAPSDPSREGYNFLGWDGLFAKIDRARTIRAIYDPQGLGSVYKSGTFGNNRSMNNSHYINFLYWNLYDSGILTVNGRGAMTTSSGGAPWSDYASSVKEARVSEGISRILIGAFANCTNLTKVTFSQDIATIGSNVFFNCPALTDIYFEGTRAQWEKVSVDSTNDKMLENVNIHCIDDVKEYTVTFVDFDGTVLKTETVLEGKSATAPSDPSREGYTFTGWDKDFSVVTEDITVTAQYEQIMCMVTFYGYEGPIEAQLIPYGGSATAPEVPSYIDGYTFTGWDTDFSYVVCDFDVCAVYVMTDDPGPEPMPEDEGDFADGLHWHYDGNGTLTISGNGAIPDYDSYYESDDPAVMIGVPWDMYLPMIYEVKVEEGITSIGEYGLGSFAEARSLYLPATLTDVDERAFSGFTGLEYIEVSESSNTFMTKNYMLCSKDESTLVLCVGHYPDISVEIDGNVTEISPYAFENCYYIEAINVSSENENYYSVDGVLFEKSTNTLVKYPAGKFGESYEIPEGTKAVASNAFEYVMNLCELYIPASVEVIDTNWIFNSMSLSAITVSEDNVTYASVEGNLTDKEGLNLYYCPTGTVPNGIQEIWGGAFDLNSVYEITIPVSVTQIHSNVFYTFVNQINYLGTSKQWNAIYIAEEGNEYLQYAYINYN